MPLHEIKQRLQAHLSDGLALVVGSGLSCAEGLPGMGSLADHLKKVIGPGLGEKDLAAWHDIIPLLDAKGLEGALLQVQPTAGLDAAIVEATAALVGEAERRVVTEIFAGARQLRITRLIPHLLKPPAGLPIITTNYDRLLEIGAEEAGLGVDTMFAGRFAGRLNERDSQFSFCRNVAIKGSRATLQFQSRALICKPHGSLDWYLRGDEPVHYAADLPGATRLIITPGQNKFRDGYDSPFDHHRSRANMAIDRASRLLILGYGFNDDHLETHLLPAIRRGTPTLILTQALSPVALDLALKHTAVVAIHHDEVNGVEGTRIIADGQSSFVANLALWDVHSFVTEVLEP